MKIRVRAWDSTERKMYYPEDIHNASDIFIETASTGTLEINKVLDSYGLRRTLISLISTNNFDSKGTEIFEGDYIITLDSLNKEASVVRYDHRICKFVLIPHLSLDFDYKSIGFTYNPYNYRLYKVIGNIYAGCR